jgi:hypothetical protein
MTAAREDIVALPSDAARALVRQLRHDALAELFELWTSLGISVSESAFRGDMLLTAVHMRQARDVMREAFESFRELEPNIAVAILDCEPPDKRGQAHE